MLIRDGATLVRSAQDVIDALPQLSAAPVQSTLDLPPPKPKLPRPLSEIAALHREILNRLGPAPLAEDQLIRDMSHAPHLITPVITRMELRGELTRQAGGLLARTSQRA